MVGLDPDRELSIILAVMVFMMAAGEANRDLASGSLYSACATGYQRSQCPAMTFRSGSDRVSSLVV